MLLEEYPSPAEGIGLENRQGCQSPQGFESPFLLHIFKIFIYLSSRGGAREYASLSYISVPIEQHLE